MCLIFLYICLPQFPSLKPVWPTLLPKQLSTNWLEAKILFLMLFRSLLIPPIFKLFLFHFNFIFLLKSDFPCPPYTPFLFCFLFSVLFLPFGVMTKWKKKSFLCYNLSKPSLFKDLNISSLHCAASSAPGQLSRVSTPTLPPGIRGLKCLIQNLWVQICFRIQNLGDIIKTVLCICLYYISLVGWNILKYIKISLMQYMNIHTTWEK